MERPYRRVYFKHRLSSRIGNSGDRCDRASRRFAVSVVLDVAFSFHRHRNSFALFGLDDGERDHPRFSHPPPKAEILPLAVSVGCAAVASAVLAWRHAPRIWVHLSILWMAISVVFIILITLVWKISGHSATVTGLTTILIFSIGASVWWLALTVPVMVWARVSLRRHTLRQTLAGSLLGFAAGAALVLWNGRMF